MRRVLLAIVTVTFSLFCRAQDFATRFMDALPADSGLVCITISPKMMEEILKSDTEKDAGIVEIISNLKSMQLLSSGNHGDRYYTHALEVLDKNEGLFEALLTDSVENSRILIRKKEDTIIELVMLSHTGEKFSVINFTGHMDSDFIARIAGAMQAP